MSIPTFVREQLNMADEKPQELSDVNLREHIRAMEETYIESMNIKNAHLTAAQTKMQILQERLQQKEAEMHQSLEAKDKVSLLLLFFFLFIYYSTRFTGKQNILLGYKQKIINKYFFLSKNSRLLQNCTKQSSRWI